MKRNEMLEILNDGFNHSVKDVLWGNVLFTDELKKLLTVRSVEKLSRIKQNGPTYLIYPGSVHTRLSHSIGVYCLSRQILLSIARKNDELPLTKSGMMSFLVAALLHDIGHFPYAHSLKELPIREHEEIAASLINGDSELCEAVKRTGADPEMTGAIIDKAKATEDSETVFYRGILSGTLDPDKLDYLSRDAYFSGVPYGTQNTDYIISSLDYRDGSIVMKEEALVSVEHVLFSKYLMYKTIYWHKGTRCATAMIKKALLSALEDGVITPEDLYLKDDDEFNELATIHSSYRPFVLIDMVKHGQLLAKKGEWGLDELPRLTKEASDLSGRRRVENAIRLELQKIHPEIEEQLVIIDIPEPIRFEYDMKLLRADGSVSEIREDESVFSRMVGKSFSENLRKLSVFAPEYVDACLVAKILEEIFG